MRAEILTVTEVVRHFSDYINRVAYRHETFVLRKGGKSVAEIRPIPTGRRLGDLPAMFRSIPHLSKDDADAFEQDVNAARAKSADGGWRDPWAS